MEIDSATKVSEPKKGAGSKKDQSKASTSLTTVLEDVVNDGDMVGELKHKLAAYNLESSPGSQKQWRLKSQLYKLQR